MKIEAKITNVSGHNLHNGKLTLATAEAKTDKGTLTVNLQTSEPELGAALEAAHAGGAAVVITVPEVKTEKK